MRPLPMLLLLAACQATTAAPAPRAPTPTAEDGLPLKSLDEPEMPKSGCALFLWTVSPVRKLVLTARRDRPAARIALASGPVELARAATQGPDVLGFTPGATYSDGSRTLAYELSIQQRPDVRNGALVPGGSLRFDMAGGESVVMPVTGLIRCA